MFDTVKFDVHCLRTWALCFVCVCKYWCEVVKKSIYILFHKELLHTINTFSMVLSVMSIYSQHSSPNSTSQPTMASLLRYCFHSLLSALKANFSAVHTYKYSLDTKKEPPFTCQSCYLLFNRGWWNPFFLFSLSDLLVPSFPHSLISVPPFTLLSLPVTSHIRPFCTLLFVPFFNARAPLFLQSFPHKTLKALIPLSATFYEESILQHWLCFTFSCWVFDILKQHFLSTNNLEPRSCTRHQVMTKY